MDRLERLLSSSALMDLLGGVQSLQTEIRELRGEVERQSHAVDQLKQRQRELYLDIDRRLRGMEAGGAGVAAAAPEAPSESPGTAAAAAEAPAKPEPTTIRLNLRLLAGLTNFMSNLCRDQAVAMGPVGQLALSSMATNLPPA